MNYNNNIIRLARIRNCCVCGSHFSPLFHSHQLCKDCYHGRKVYEGIATASDNLMPPK